MKQILPIVAITAFLAACSESEDQSGQQDAPDKVTGRTNQEDDREAEKEDLIGDLLSLGSVLVESADDVGQELFSLTEEEQKEIGEHFHKQLKSEHDFQEGSAQQARIRRLAAPFKRVLSRKDLTLKFFIIEADEVNAFSHVGGYIYFNTGLLDIISTDAELQFVLGHEIAHLELGHCERLLTYTARARGLGGALAGGLGADSAELISSLVYQTLCCSYSEDQELACDAWSYRAMRKSGVSHKDCCAMSRKFLRREEKAGSSGNKSPGSTGKLKSELDAHFRTHPPAKKRLEALEKLK